MTNEEKFVKEIIEYIFTYPDDDYMTMECLCRKLVKYKLMKKIDGYYIADRKTEPQTDCKMPYEDCEDCETHLKAQMEMADRKTEPQIEPNLILPERMERGERFEVGETIVVMNRDDYYDLLCKSWKDESHTDTHDEAIKAMATLIKAKDEPQTDTHDIRTETHECVKDTHDKTEPQTDDCGACEHSRITCRYMERG